MSKRKVLVIDDDLFWHRLLRRLFDGTDYEVHTADNCGDGVRLAEEQRPDCILLDFHLKDGDAVDVCTELKKGGEHPRFPVIVVSSDPAAEITAYAECKADYFVLKGSHTIAELPRIVSAVLGRAVRTISYEPE